MTMENSKTDFMTRRKFVATSVTAVAASTIFSSVGAQTSDQQPLTINQVIALIKQSISFDESRGTVDTVKSGNPDQPVTGIVTTMFATVDVIRKAIDLKANFIIAHEPTFYNHQDDTTWLQDHDVYKLKRELLDKNNIVVWRFHDFWHSNRPDGVFIGVLTSLGWEKYYDEKQPRLLQLPKIPLSELISHLKTNLGINTLRYIGDPSLSCSRIALLPGAPGGRAHMNTIHDLDPDVLICGELQEWETSEYIRDSRSLGIKRAVVVLGHAVSEEPGMKWLVGWLQPKVPGVKITHVPANSPFSYA
jgi:putative NIF3 family GTP cyclohydrolase 1 type 2